MHPQVSFLLAKQRRADEHGWAERQRRARITRGEPSPDVLAFDEPVEHLSFAARVRSLVEALRGGSDASAAAGS